MTLGQGRDIAAIILILEVFLLSLIVLAAFYLAVRGMHQLLPLVRRWLRVAYEWVLKGALVVETLMRWLMAPILLLAGLLAGVRVGVAALRRR